jgi:glycosyltransferase involved in cell wall biosynthesis
MHGSFFFFSELRLRKIADEVHARRRPDAQLDFFHGFTPWILSRPGRSYIAWGDCTFHDYVNIFHRREEFDGQDVKRIEQAESGWLRNAHRVLFTSNWAVQRAVRDYGLDPRRVSSVGIFGELDMPSRDAYTGGNEFAFVSTNFEAKGGRMVLKAFRDVRKHHPEATLVVIGDRPSGATAEAGVSFTGYLRKEVPDEYRRFQQILGGARALVGATSSDICPLQCIEAGYVGCPVIMARKFAIPEIVDDGRTGLLLDPVDSRNVGSAMQWMLEHPGEYERMRLAAWNKARGQYSRARFEERLQACVEASLEDGVGEEQQRLKSTLDSGIAPEYRPSSTDLESASRQSTPTARAGDRLQHGSAHTDHDARRRRCDGRGSDIDSS